MLLHVEPLVLVSDQYDRTDPSGGGVSDMLRWVQDLFAELQSTLDQELEDRRS